MTDKHKNYIRAKAIEEQNKARILAVCPSADESSGIYMFHRIDENGQCHAYVGKAMHLIARLSSHLRGYSQHIDKSIREYGLWSIDNPHGYQIAILCRCPLLELNDKERECIQLVNAAMYKLKNVESGGTTGKTDINERKPVRGYREGVRQGERNVIKKIAHLFDLHLKAVPKSDKPSKNAVNALDKFNSLLQGETDNEQLN